MTELSSEPYSPFSGAWGDRAFTAVLACNDNIIRVIEASTVTHEIKLTDTPVTLQLFLGDGGSFLNLGVS